MPSADRGPGKAGHWALRGYVPAVAAQLITKPRWRPANGPGESSIHTDNRAPALSVVLIRGSNHTTRALCATRIVTLRSGVPALSDPRPRDREAMPPHADALSTRLPSLAEA